MTGLDIPGYIDLYEKSWADLVQQMPDVQGYEAGSIQRTWAISFARIKRQNPLASNLLQLIARFDCHDIWVDLIMNGNQGTETPEWFRDITKSKVSFLAALGLLFDFSLLRRANAMDSFSMHPVVHQWVAMSVKENLGDFIRIAVVAIAFTSPGDGDPESWILQKRLRPHADRIYGYVCGPSQIAIDWGSWETQDVPKLSEGAEVVEQSWTDAQMEHPLRRLGWLYGEGMQEFEKAKSIFQLGMDTVQEIHGNKHPLVFRFANCLALVCRDLGEWEDAEILANSALQGFLAWFGKENKWTINSLACFPLICYARGEYAKAVELGEELLSILRSNPDAWPDALSYTLNNLSVFYGANDQPDKAIEMIEESLLLKFKRLDPDHPLIMTGLENLAGRYMDAGSYMESERVLKQCIEGYEKSYGLKSRETIAANDYLAHLYHKMGRLVEAEEIYRTAVRDYEELLGLNHPDTVRCASNLCIMIFQQWNEACPFVVDGSGAEQAQAPSPFPRQQLLELCRVMLKYPGQIDYFGYVAKVLFRYGKSDQSRLVLQGQATREYGCWSYTSRSCDAIDSEHFIGSERFACMVCEDLDLCRDCMATYNGQKINGGGCIGHPFLDVSIPSRMLSVNLLDQAKSTLRAIIEEYSATDTTALHVVMSTSEASQKRDATSPKKIPVIREQTFGTKLQAISWLKPNRKGK
jgi:tetratricopeptide (TPR) repeat protein